ncbi:hypothetical protein [Bradyrhizobium sp. B120]|uniref:hypothetical protein n=1 Tax=Bradyrhizobium sp. B120 TaxID=3410088 RepID=UPI003B986AE0
MKADDLNASRWPHGARPLRRGISVVLARMKLSQLDAIETSSACGAHIKSGYLEGTETAKSRSRGAESSLIPS